MLLVLLAMHYLACHMNFISGDEPYIPDETQLLFDINLAPFYHGVASGDPSHNEVTIWTRLTPRYNREAEVSWSVTLDSSQSRIVQNGKIATNAGKDYTIKKTITGLQPDTYYWYSFSHDSKKSVVGRTKTLPVKQDTVNLIAVSCNAYESGYFTAFEVIAKKKEKIDAVLHLGDYIYEGFLPQYFEVKERVPLPKRECIQLQDYRTRYAQYRLDKQLQLAHQMHPFIHIWDDHEIANDANRNSAQGHDPAKEGAYESRKANARQAFYEWLPIKADARHYRQFDMAGLVTLFLLDGRLEGRTEQKAPNDPAYESKDRAMLGKPQFNWLVNGMNNTQATWKIIGNPVLFAKFNFSPVLSNLSNRKTDSWMGYPYERNRLLHVLASQQIDNILFLSGDSHCSWAFEIQHPSYLSTTVALEFGVPAVSSGNWGTGNPIDTVLNWEDALYNHLENKHLKYVNLREHGFVQILLTAKEAKCSWYYVNKTIQTIREITKKDCVVKEGIYKID